MKLKNKIRVAVLYGGRSAEHEISLRSAANVIQYLDQNLFEIIPIGIDKQGNWFLGHDIFQKSLENYIVPKLFLDDHAWFTAEWVGRKANQQHLAELTKQPLFDVIFPVVHGTFCEDGSLQGLLEQTNLPYVGCGVLASSLGMEKEVSKRLVKLAGIPVAPYVAVKQDVWPFARAKLMAQIKSELGYPVFVKPVSTGSSIGIHKVKSQEDLEAKILDAFRFDTKVLIEKGLNVHELEVAVLESLVPNTEPIVSVVGEIVTHGHEFYSYDAKYLDANGAKLIIPTLVPKHFQDKAREVAKQIFSILECEGMARVDLFLNKENNQIYFNEINTIPGFTEISMYPKLMTASGMPYSELLTNLINLALKRHGRREKLIRSYEGP